MRPMPMIPRVLLNSSVPWNFFFSHLPSRMELAAWGMLRARAIMSDKACSAVVMVLPPGVFITTMPRFEAAGMSTLSSPVPARPTTFNRGEAAIRSAVTLVALRMTRASASLISASNSSGFMPGRATTSMLGWDLRMSIPAWCKLSLIRTFMPLPPWSRSPGPPAARRPAPPYIPTH